MPGLPLGESLSQRLIDGGLVAADREPPGAARKQVARGHLVKTATGDRRRSAEVSCITLPKGCNGLYQLTLESDGEPK